MEHSRRRNILRISGTALAAGLAGCSSALVGNSSSGDETSGGNADSDNGDTAGRSESGEECKKDMEWQSVPLDKSAWTVQTGEWEFNDGVIRQANQATASESDTSSRIFYDGAEITNGVFEVEINSVDGDNGQSMTFRKQTRDGRHEYYAFGSAAINPSGPSGSKRLELAHPSAKGDSDNFRHIEKLPAAESSFPPLETDSFHTYRVVFEDTFIRAYFEDELVFAVGDATQTGAGKIGFHCGSLTEFRNPRYGKL